MQRLIAVLAWRAWLLALAFVASLAQFDAVAQSAREAYDKGLLWRIEKPGITPSYLFGTVHLADTRVTTLPEVVRARLDGAQSFTIETSLEASDIAVLTVRMVYIDGRDLPGVAGEELFRKVTPLMASHGVPPELARLFKPWAVALLLAMPQQQTEDVLDFTLFRLASRQGKSLHYLESADDQVAAFESMTEADQIALLRHTVETHGELPGMAEKMVQAYLQRDLGLMWQLNEAGAKDRPDLKALNAVFAQRLLYDRNVRMAERMRPQLDAGNAFVAIGALHLYGERGVPGLLARDGYRVSRIY